jgi:BirA family biotin operon repressor/biotin-[acetyl-CoA-carboxylase] ligase
MPAITLTSGDIRRQCRHELALRSRSGSAAGAEEILRYGAFVGSAVECHAFLDRAMDHGRAHIAAMEKAGRSVHNGTVILADCLGASKGRFDRVWHAPAGGLWGCLIHANTLLTRSRGLISLAVGVACCEAVREMGGAAQVRWVNDVLVHGRKVAGFLIEGFISPCFREEYNLIGFGININNSHFPPDLRDTAIALSEVLGHPLDLNLFARTFLAKLSFNLGLLYFEEERELRDEEGSAGRGGHRLLQNWRQLSDTIGRRVVYGLDVLQKPQYRAEVEGISDTGGIILRLDDGHEKTEYCGEIRYL